MEGRGNHSEGGTKFRQVRKNCVAPQTSLGLVRLGLSIADLVVRVNERISRRRSQLMRQGQKLRGGIVTVARHHPLGVRHRSPAAQRVIRE